MAPLPKPEPRTSETKQQFLVPVGQTSVAVTRPSLPRQDSLQDGPVVTVLGDDARKPQIPGWLISLLVMVTVLLMGVAALLYLLPASQAEQTSPSTAPVAQVAVVNSASSQVHPLTKVIEVSGIRVVVDPKQGSTIQYLVINHSSAELADVVLAVTVKSTSKPQQPPVTTFSVRVPALAPYESREFVAALESPVKTVESPDWQNLRADVIVTTP